MKTTIVIAENHTLIRESWEFILNNDSRFQVIGSFDTAEEAVKLAETMKPNIAIMDINLPGMNGFDATQMLKKVSPKTKVLGISIHNQPKYAARMIKMGAKGYITKNSPYDEVVKAILEIQSGKKYICEEIKENLNAEESSEQKKPLSSLSIQEINVLNGLQRGFTSKQIAEELSVSCRTVEVHRYNIMKKLQFKNTASLINYLHHSELSIL